MSPSPLAHTEHPHHRRQVPNSADCLLTSEGHCGAPTGKELIQLCLTGAVSRGRPQKDSAEHLSLNELLQLGLFVCNSGWFSLQETIQYSFVSNLHPHITYIIKKYKREHYPKLVFRASVIGGACYILLCLTSQQEEHSSCIVLHAWSLDTALEAHKVTIAGKYEVISARTSLFCSRPKS